MEVNNYYPYGLLNSSLSYSRSGNRYKYQTKEVDNYFDYNVLDFGARHGVYPERSRRDPATARWTVYDPASQYATPYIAMGGNPVSGIDPDGRKSHRMSDAQANLQQAQGEMAAVDNATGGGGAVPWYYYSSRDVAAMQLQYGTTYEQQTQEHFATLGMFGVTGDIASAPQQNDMLTLYNIKVANAHTNSKKDGNLSIQLFQWQHDNPNGSHTISGYEVRINGLSTQYGYDEWLGRPDGDFKLTLKEVNDWFRKGNRGPLFADLNMVDMGTIQSTFISDFPTPTQAINLFYHSSMDAAVYGTLKLTLIDANHVKSTNGYEMYDFDYKDWTHPLRNFGTWLGSSKAGNGNPFPIVFFGEGLINKPYLDPSMLK